MRRSCTYRRGIGRGLLLALAVCLSCREDRTETAQHAASIPERIITLAPNAVEIIAALGASDRLVGVSTFCVYPPEVASLPRVGGLFNPDLETIVRLEADLVVLRGRSDVLERLCKDRGIRVYLDPTERFEDIFLTIRELGRILDRGPAAERLQFELRARLDRIASAIDGLPRPRVFLTIARRPDSLAGILTAGKETFVNEILTRAGGENVFAHLAMDYPQVSPEAILAARPDVIIEAMPEAEPSTELTERVQGLWRALGPMPAARSGRIFVLTEDHALIPSPRIVDVIARIAELLHPGVDLRGPDGAVEVPQRTPSRGGRMEPNRD